METFINEVVNYYAKSTQADNHAVREAACACIAELGNKVRKFVITVYEAFSTSVVKKSLLKCQNK